MPRSLLTLLLALSTLTACDRPDGDAADDGSEGSPSDDGASTDEGMSGACRSAYDCGAGEACVGVSVPSEGCQGNDCADLAGACEPACERDDQCRADGMCRPESVGDPIGTCSDPVAMLTISWRNATGPTGVPASVRAFADGEAIDLFACDESYDAPGAECRVAMPLDGVMPHTVRVEWYCPQAQDTVSGTYEALPGVVEPVACP